MNRAVGSSQEDFHLGGGAQSTEEGGFASYTSSSILDTGLVERPNECTEFYRNTYRFPLVLFRKYEELQLRLLQINQSLKMRYEERGRMNAELESRLEYLNRYSLRLQSENEKLRSALEFNRAEILYLNLKAEGLDVGVGIDDTSRRDGGFNRPRNSKKADEDDQANERVEAFKSELREVTELQQVRKSACHQRQIRPLSSEGISLGPEEDTRVGNSGNSTEDPDRWTDLGLYPPAERLMRSGGVFSEELSDDLESPTNSPSRRIRTRGPTDSILGESFGRAHSIPTPSSNADSAIDVFSPELSPRPRYARSRDACLTEGWSRASFGQYDRRYATKSTSPTPEYQYSDTQWGRGPHGNNLFGRGSVRSHYGRGMSWQDGLSREHYSRGGRRDDMVDETRRGSWVGSIDSEFGPFSSYHSNSESSIQKSESCGAGRSAEKGSNTGDRPGKGSEDRPDFFGEYEDDSDQDFWEIEGGESGMEFDQWPDSKEEEDGANEVDERDRSIRSEGANHEDDERPLESRAHRKKTPLEELWDNLARLCGSQVGY